MVATAIMFNAAENSQLLRKRTLIPVTHLMHLRLAVDSLLGGPGVNKRVSMGLDSEKNKVLLLSHSSPLT